MSIVVIKGTEGLGNRLLSLEFALRFAHNRQYAVEIDWSDPVYMVDKDCFVKHFELIGIELISVDRKNPVFAILQHWQHIWMMTSTVGLTGRHFFPKSPPPLLFGVK